MATITQRAEDALRDHENYISPVESLEYLSKPQNFQSFAKYMERLFKEKNIEAAQENPGSYLSQIVLALEPIPDNQKRNIKNFFSRVFQTDAQENSPKMKPIPRKIAIKLCFALGLDVDESKDFLRKACNTYSFNVRDEYEATCLYCLLTRQDYSMVLSLLKQYENASLDHVELESTHQTQIMNAVLSGSNWESNEQFLNTFLIPNKFNFIKNSRTTVQKYSELRCSLCEQIIQWNLASYEDRNDIEKAEADELLHSVKEGIIELAAKDSDFAKYIAEFSNVTTAENVLSKIEAQLRAKHPTSSQGIDTYYEFINKSVSSRQLVKQTLWGIPYIFKESQKKKKILADGEFAPRKNSLLNDSPLMDCFPGRDPVDTLDKSALESSKTLTARKTIVFLCFMNEFFDNLCSEANYTRNADNPELAERQYNNFYTRLNNTLIECGIAQLYPADPFDWLILKSARALTQLDRDSDPIEYFNDILRLSFPS